MPATENFLELAADGQPPLNKAQIARFQEDGFLVIDHLLSEETVRQVTARFEPLFRGDFPTGLYPDEWNWQEGRDSADLTRQICNGWKSDPTIAGVVLSPLVGRLCATLAGWPGARMAQDNVLWKPPGAKALGFHQDESYIQWVVPPQYLTCWIALDPTTRDGGTIEYVRGSHRWNLSPMVDQFHAPDDYREAMEAAAVHAGATPEIVQIEVPAGACVLHAGRTWHGSGPNLGDRPRRSVVAHCIPSNAQFHRENISYIYSRYKHAGDKTMDESFFPILWAENGYRSVFLDS